jgi:hypothetical protein
MRFLADENVSRFVVEGLRVAGFDVAAIGAMNPGASDVDGSGLRVARVVSIATSANVCDPCSGEPDEADQMFMPRSEETRGRQAQAR